jgi:hypothetical protein
MALLLIDLFYLHLRIFSIEQKRYLLSNLYLNVISPLYPESTTPTQFANLKSVFDTDDLGNNNPTCPSGTSTANL